MTLIFFLLSCGALAFGIYGVFWAIKERTQQKTLEMKQYYTATAGWYLVWIVVGFIAVLAFGTRLFG